MGKVRTEDEVRDWARGVLDLYDKPGVRAGAGQITTFNQLGFPGVADKPDGWYLPDSTVLIVVDDFLKSGVISLSVTLCVLLTGL